MRAWPPLLGIIPILTVTRTYVDAFRSIYDINTGLGTGAAAATGRYPEDVYQGGNVRPVSVHFY